MAENKSNQKLNSESTFPSSKRVGKGKNYIFKILNSPFFLIYWSLVKFGDSLIWVGNNIAYVLLLPFNRGKTPTIQNSNLEYNEGYIKITKEIDAHAKSDFDPTVKVPISQIFQEEQDIFQSNTIPNTKSPSKVGNGVQRFVVRWWYNLFPPVKHRIKYNFDDLIESTVADQLIASKLPEIDTGKNIKAKKTKRKALTEVSFNPEQMELLTKLFEKLSSQQTNLTTKTNLQPRYVLVAGLTVLVLVLINTFFLVFDSPLKRASASSSENQIVSNGVQNLVSDTNQPGVRIVQDFSDNKVVAEVGSQIVAVKEKINTKGTKNCQTPVIPPIENGCEFVILPTSLSIPVRGTVYRTIQFEATITGEAELILDLKDYEKSKVIADIGVVNANNLNKRLLLPETITGVQGIQVRVWEKGGGRVEIRKMSIQYYNVQSLIPVSGKIEKRPENVSGGLAVLYQDVNENKQFDVKTDKPWSCRPNFPGIMPVLIDESNGFVLYRDEACYIDVKPDNWYIDEKKSVLPEGYWLLVFDGGKEVYNFSINQDQKESVLNLQPSI